MMMGTNSRPKSIQDSKFIFIVTPKLTNFANLSPESTENFGKRRCNQPSHAGILRVFLFFCHVLCISPFHISKKSGGPNAVRRWTIQQILCFLVTIATLFTRVTDVRKAFPSGSKDWNPVAYFRIFFTICSFCLSLNAWWSLWLKKDRFVNVVDYMDSTKALPYLSTRVPLAVLAALACTAYTALGFVSAFFGTDLIAISDWTPDNWIRCLVLESRYQFFSGPRSNCSLPVIATVEPTEMDYFLAGITGFGQMFKYITAFLWELLILFGVISLWLPAAAFADTLKKATDDEDDEGNGKSEEQILEAIAEWPVLEEQYLSLKDLSDLVNNAFGAMVFSYTFTSIFYYSINLDAFLLTSDILVRIRLIVLYLGAVVMYILAADVCRQVGYLEVWLSEYADDEDKSNVPFHRLTVILNELSTNTIGITGWNVFTITYSVVANMTSVLITYFIICVQFRQPKL